MPNPSKPAQPSRTRILLALTLLIGVVAVGGAYWTQSRRGPSAVEAEQLGLDASAYTLQTPHYRVISTASPEQTAQVGLAVERLHAAYTHVFATPAAPGKAGELRLVLYRDRAEFKAHNRSSPWAEAFYRTPYCHAYYDVRSGNPYHWMLHEATHQLNREVARLPKAKWSDEGLAAYFGASRLVDDRLQPGTIDVQAYPIWWLSDWVLSGDLDADVRAGRFIPLRDLIAGTGPAIDRNVNLYYLEYWSLTHFLFHYENGRYAERYRQVIAEGSSLQAFERHLGPMEARQQEWYAYVRQVRRELLTPDWTPVNAIAQGDDPR